MLTRGANLFVTTEPANVGSYVCVAEADQKRIEKIIQIRWLGKQKGQTVLHW